MKHKPKYIIWLFFFWMLIISFPVWAEDPIPMTGESMLLEKINEARENPLAMAASFGMDPDTLLEEHPELQHILINGLLPVNFNDRISQAARSHVADMVTHRYYDYASIDGKSVAVRIAATGYDVNVSGELLGMLGFFNYIAPDLAADRIFENMFLKELDPANFHNRKILNPAFRDAGAAMDAGVFQIGRSQINVYMAACDFAAKPMWILENEYLALVNQARANPLEMAKILGMDPDKIIQDHPEISDLLKNGVAPVIFNRYLYASAMAHGRDMLNHAYFSKNSKDGQTVADRISDTGYQAAESDEVIGSIFGSTTVSLKNMAFQIFATKFKAELERTDDEPLVFLNPDFTDAGLSLLAQYIKKDDTSDDSKYLMMVADFAKPAEAGPSTLWAMIYKDKDGNGMYSRGEGCGGVEVTVKGNDLNFKINTDFIGRVVVPLPAGAYWIRTSDDGTGEEVGTFIEINYNKNTETNNAKNDESSKNHHGLWLQVNK